MQVLKIRFLKLTCLARPGVICTIILISTPLQAAIYKWVDDQGQVHYGSEPAQGNTTVEELTIRALPTTKPRISKEDIELDAINRQEAEAERKKQETQQPKKVKPKIPAGEKRRLCIQARNDIKTILSRGRMREINAKGEYIYLSEKERQKRITAARKRISKYCH